MKIKLKTPVELIPPKDAIRGTDLTILNVSNNLEKKILSVKVKERQDSIVVLWKGSEYDKLANKIPDGQAIAERLASVLGSALSG